MKATKDKDGKTIFTKTDKDLEYTNYIFRDLAGDKIVLMSKNNTFRELEGLECNIDINITFDEFKRRNRYALSLVEQE